MTLSFQEMALHLNTIISINWCKVKTMSGYIPKTSWITNIFVKKQWIYYSPIAIVKVSTGGIVLTGILFAVIEFLFTKISFPTRKAHALVVLREYENYTTFRSFLITLGYFDLCQFMIFFNFYRMSILVKNYFTAV